MVDTGTIEASGALFPHSRARAHRPLAETKPLLSSVLQFLLGGKLIYWAFERLLSTLTMTWVSDTGSTFSMKGRESQEKTHI
jgi:hypothetical protein